MTNDAANIEYDGIERISILNAFHEDLESTLEIVEILMELINGDPEMTEKEGRKYEKKIRKARKALKKGNYEKIPFITKKGIDYL